MNKKHAWPLNSAESKDLAYHLHPYTDPSKLMDSGPHIIESGDGIYITDNENNRFIEGVSGLWCTSFGFSELELAKAAFEQLKQLPYYHSFGGKASDPSINLAEKLVSIAPEGLEKVFFCNSGSEANDTAVKLVWYYHASQGYPERKKIISRKRKLEDIELSTKVAKK